MNENYGADPWREPKPDEDDTVIFSEHGRSLDKTDYRSHWFMMVKAQVGGYSLLVHHGGGQERFDLGHLHFYRGEYSRIIRAMEAMDTDARYLMLYTFYDIATDARRREGARVAAEMKLAFVEGRLKKRKIRGQSAYKVTIEPRQEVRQ
jgi:hypothetical protein